MWCNILDGTMVSNVCYTYDGRTLILSEGFFTAFAFGHTHIHSLRLSDNGCSRHAVWLDLNDYCGMLVCVGRNPN